MKKIILKVLKIVIILCTLAFVYFRTRLFSMSYEYDELFTAITSDPSIPLSWIWNNWLIVDVHPPLYNVILWVWNHFVPYGPELWLRFPSFLLGLGALACAWFLFPKRFGKTARLLFIALISCNLYMTVYGQHARSYMLVLILSVPLTFLFLNMSRAVWKQREITARQWVQFGVLSLLLCWSHYFGALLFGIFSLALFGQALYYKRHVKWFMIVPCAVFAGFLPWLVPNFMAQLEYQRFSGNWWAASDSVADTLGELLSFFFTTLEGYMIVCVMVVAGAVWLYRKYKRLGGFAHAREIILLSSAILAVFAVVGIVSLRTYMFIGRYFTVILPSLYLVCALLIAPLLRRSVVISLVFVAFIVMNTTTFWQHHTALLTTPIMPARLVSQFYRDYFRGKPMYVIALEAFPPPSMPAMYGFYANKVYHLDIPVTELFALPEDERNEALKHRENAFIWMPNCSPDKLDHVSKAWNRAIGIYGKLGSVCLLEISEEGDLHPKQWGPGSVEVQSVADAAK